MRFPCLRVDRIERRARVVAALAVQWLDLLRDGGYLILQYLVVGVDAAPTALDRIRAVPNDGP